MRILSLLPSATEIVYLLGIEDSLVGISHECDYPPEVRTKPVISASPLPASLRSDEVHEAVKRHSHSSHSLYRIDENLLRHLGGSGAGGGAYTGRILPYCFIGTAQSPPNPRHNFGRRRRDETQRQSQGRN